MKNIPKYIYFLNKPLPFLKFGFQKGYTFTNLAKNCEISKVSSFKVLDFDLWYFLNFSKWDSAVLLLFFYPICLHVICPTTLFWIFTPMLNMFLLVTIKYCCFLDLHIIYYKGISLVSTKKSLVRTCKLRNVSSQSSKKHWRNSF